MTRLRASAGLSSRSSRTPTRDASSPRGTSLREGRIRADGRGPERGNGDFQHACRGDDEGGRRTVKVRFADSPKMSSYLLFLALGDLERLT